MYWNNHGALKLTVTRLAGGGGNMPTQSVLATETLTRLALALQGLDADARLGPRLEAVLPGGPDEPAAKIARDKLLLAAATPDARLKMADELGCTYDELTKWVIWCDLRRHRAVDWPLAQALEAAGVKGVRDLAAWAKDERRRAELQAALSKSCPTLRPDILLRLGKWARKQPALITADTTVIVVVKGAGLQQADQTLGEFLDGFWPAVSRLDPTATLTQRHDVLPPGYISTPYDPKPLNLVTEIRSGERRIWIKEPNWDAASVPESALTALNKEWRMATYALASWIHEFFAEQDTRRRELPAERSKNFWRFLAANTWLNWAVFLHAGLALNWAFGQYGHVPRMLLLGVLLVPPAVVLAIKPAWQAYARKKKSVENKEPLEALPGMVNFGLVMLLLAFLISPWGYLLWVCAGATILLALLRARAIAWPDRQEFDGDTTPNKFYSVAGEHDPVTGRPRVYRRRNRTGLVRLVPWRWYIWQYRYLIVLGLPLTFLALLLARFLKWTKILGGLGELLEGALSRVLSGGLGDVATYAMDPAKANSIRHVIQTDLLFFHDLPYVSKLHVFAHSQGTPITFETLFNHLPEPATRKIATYVTIGSVLSYYHQTNPMLDPIFMRRFPVRRYRPFATGFRWVNFWNLTDPITEFCGLDEYALVSAAPMLPVNPQTNLPSLPTAQAEREALERQTQFYEASPTNIKSPASSKNHSEYWSNLDCVHGPLAQRVLGDQRPAEWDKRQFARRQSKIPHNVRVTLLFGICLILWLGPSLLVLLNVWPYGAFKGPIAQATTMVIESALEPLKILGLWHNFWWTIRGWIDAWTVPGPWLGAARQWLEALLPAVTPVKPSATEVVTTPWPVRFLAELIMSLLTAGAYFGLLGTLNFVYTGVSRGSMRVVRWLKARLPAKAPRRP